VTPQRCKVSFLSMVAAIQVALLSAVMVATPAATAGQKVVVEKLLSTAGATPTTVPLPVTTITALGATVVEDYEAMAVVDLGPTTATALAQATGLMVSPLPDHDKVLLRHYTLTAGGGLPPSVVAPPFPATQPNLYLVVLRSIPKAEWIDAINEGGGQVVSYMPNNTYLVYARLADLDAIRAKATCIVNVLPFVPAFRLLDQDRLFGADGYAKALVKVLDVSGSDAVIAEIQANALPGTFAKFRLGSSTCVLGELPNDTVRSLAFQPEVIAIEPAPLLTPSGERDALIVAGQLISAFENGRTVYKPDASVDYYSWLTQKGLGPLSDVLLGVLDTGLDTGSTTDVHADFRSATGVSRVLFQDGVAQAGNTSDCLAHGTLVAAVMAGSGGASTYNTTSSESATFSSPCAGCTGTCPTPTNCSGGTFFAGAGVAPTAKIASAKLYDDSGNDGAQVATRVNTALSLFANHGVWVANLSSNDPSTAYTTFSQDLDQRVRDARGDPLCGTYGHPACYPISIVISAGNTFGNVQAPATAKNVISVGSSEGYNPFLNQTICIPSSPCAPTNGAINAHDIACFSGHGTPPPPNGDGRIKPDIVAPGTRVMGALTRVQPQPPSSCWNGQAKACGRNQPGNADLDGTLPGMGGSNPMTWSYGTSFAAPAVTGAAGLVAYWYRAGHFILPSPALIKAMLINWAVDIYDGQWSGQSPPIAVGHIPSPYQGWGKADLGRGFPSLANVYTFDQQYVFTQSGQTPWSKNLRVRDTGKPVRVTLIWTDKEGTSSSGKVVQNNLVLTIATPVGRFSGDRFNLTTGESILYTRVPFPIDLTNNVQHVVFTPSTYGISTITVNVVPNTIAAKAIPNGPGTVNQDFALFVDNACEIGVPGC